MTQESDVRAKLLINGCVPPGMVCPYADECDMECPVGRDAQRKHHYSCAMARMFETRYLRELGEK